MSKPLLKEGGPHKIRKTGTERYTYSISLPMDDYGRVGRQCPNKLCSPGYFKVKIGTGITGGQKVAYCPYCRHQEEPNGFATNEQARYAKDIVMRETQKSIQDAIGHSFGMGSSGSKKIGSGMFSIEMKYEPGSLPNVRHPFEEEIQRAIICPKCGLDHAVFGIAVWCADCGKDIFLTHVQTELAVVSLMLSDVARRRTDLGHRVAARDLENCLEDTVSIFEAVLKALVIRHHKIVGRTVEEIQRYMKKVGTTFQNLERTAYFLATEFNIAINDGIPSGLIPKLRSTYEKRHPITHNLGVVDRKYLERSLSSTKEGREIRVTIEEIESAIIATQELLKSLHARLIGSQE